MKTNVHNLIIVDASGSMSDIYEQALAGMNETIKTIVKVQHDDPNIGQYVTLLSFANGGERLQYVYRHKPISEVNEVTRKDYVLRGCTALYDAYQPADKRIHAVLHHRINHHSSCSAAAQRAHQRRRKSRYPIRIQP